VSRGRRVFIPAIVAVVLSIYGGVGCGGRGSSPSPSPTADTTAPTVMNVTSTTGNGAKIIGQTIAIQVVFSESVTVTGAPTLSLETGTTDRIATYSSGSGTDTLVFNYQVQSGDTSADLDYISTSALTLAGGTIADAAANAATLTLAAPGAATSLGANKALVVDGVVPTVTSVTSPAANITYDLADPILIEINFSEAVTVSGSPTLTLETGTRDRTAIYSSGSGSMTLVFSYTVQGYDVSADLDYTSTGSLALAGGTINDANGNTAVLTLAAPGATGSLSFNKDLVVAGVVPLLAAGQSHTCGTAPSGATRCWGLGGSGQLGNQSGGTWGNSAGEMGFGLPATNVGTGLSSIQLASGALHTCAILNTGVLKCWGFNNEGQLGRDDTVNWGASANQMGNNLVAINLGAGRTAKAVSAGFYHTCAILDDNTVKCWGWGSSGQLGYDSGLSLGNAAGEMAALATVFLGAGHTATKLSAGNNHTCVILDDGGLKCWGLNGSGQLGNGNTASQGDNVNEMSALSTINLGTGRTAKEVAAGAEHTCAILDNDTLKCWGDNAYGQLGYEDTTDRGDSPGELGDSLAAVDLGTGRYPISVFAGSYHTCAVLDNATLKCWGRNDFGQLGYESTSNLGDAAGEMGNGLAVVNVGTGRTVITAAVNDTTTCAVLDQGSIKCWGRNNMGQLGLEDIVTRGDLPATMGDALPFVNLQ
jgi:alpha-tubulin suppressor-like RCC1 family protein